MVRVVDVKEGLSLIPVEGWMLAVAMRGNEWMREGILCDNVDDITLYTQRRSAFVGLDVECDFYIVVHSNRHNQTNVVVYRLVVVIRLVFAVPSLINRESRRTYQETDKTPIPASLQYFICS